MCSYAAKHESTPDYGMVKHAKFNFLQMLHVVAHYYSANVSSVNEFLHQTFVKVFMYIKESLVLQTKYMISILRRISVKEVCKSLRKPHALKSRGERSDDRDSHGINSRDKSKVRRHHWKKKERKKNVCGNDSARQIIAKWEISMHCWRTVK